MIHPDTTTPLETVEEHVPVINYDLIRKLVQTWPRRATVRSREYSWINEQTLDVDCYDYPPSMIPFWDHPRFAELDQPIKDKVLTLAWVIYNQRTITAEEYIANPAFDLVFQDRMPGVNDIAIKQSMQQSLVDEHFHTLMHVTANAQTKQLRGLEDFPDFPHSVTYRDFAAADAELTDPWERDLLLFTFALVSEVSINAFLEILSRDKGVNPTHAMIARLHAADESAHSHLLVEVAKCIYIQMNDKQRRFFLDTLPIGLHAFLRQDYSAWEAIFDYLAIPHAREIIGDAKAAAGDAHLTRDYSGLKMIAEELDIVHQLDFQFPAT